MSWAPAGCAGPDPREMAKSDCVVIWGTNAVATQVNVMTHAIKARKERGAKIVAIDIYANDTKPRPIWGDPEARHRRGALPAR
jgi:anaerobic selenocysteine-containing dehydrogenase